jgi:hypothetical protein
MMPAQAVSVGLQTKDTLQLEKQAEKEWTNEGHGDSFHCQRSEMVG